MWCDNILITPAIIIINNIINFLPFIIITRITFCPSRSLSNATMFFIFDHVTFIQFKICCCVQNFIEIGWFLAEIWRYNDFQNGGRPLSWNCFTTMRDHPRSLAGRSCLSNFVSIWSEDVAIWIFAYLARNAYPGPQNGGFGDFGRDYSSSRPSEGNPRPLSYQL